MPREQGPSWSERKWPAHFRGWIGCTMMEGTIAGLLLHRYELWWCRVTVPATQSPPSACSPRQACPTSHPRHGASALAWLSFGSQCITR